MGDESLQLPDDNLEYCIVTLFEKIDALRNETVYMSPKFWKRHELRSLEFWRCVICECIASFCYVFIVCGASLSPDSALEGNIATALAAGFSMTTLTQCFAHISGAHINPAITVAMSIAKNITFVRAIMFVIAQCGGGIAGASFLYGLTIPRYQGNQSPTLVHEEDIVIWERLVLELILTFIIVLTHLMTMDTYTKWLGSSSLTIGASYSACTFALMPYLNPARALGPAFVLSKWHNHWVYWIGSLTGAVLSGLIYRFLLNPRRRKCSGDSDEGDSSSIQSYEDPYDPLEKPAENKYPTYRQTGNTVVTSGSGCCPSLMSASLYSAPLCKLDRVESLYGGTKSLYCKSPPLTRANLNRSQSVYTKTNSTTNRDVLPRSGPLVPAQSLYPMRLNQQQNYVQNQNVQNQIQQRTETTFTGRTIQPIGATSRSDIYGVRPNTSEAESSKYEDNSKIPRNRPNSAYGIATSHTRHVTGEDSNYGTYYGSTKRSTPNSTTGYHNTTANINAKTSTVNNGYGSRVSEAKHTNPQLLSAPSTSSTFHHAISQHSPSSQITNYRTTAMNFNSNNFGVICNASTREEYMEKLQKWIDEVRKQQHQTITFWANYVSQTQVRRNLNLNSAQRIHVTVTPTNNNIQTSVTRSYIYKIPPIWKRLIAEAIDFFILFVIKMFLTLTILESVDLIDIETNGFTALQKKLQDSKLAVQMSFELLTLEILHRCIVCCYETYWVVVQRATPGKRYMGLAIVEAVNIVPLPGQLQEVVLVTPATNLNVRNAMFRSILKIIFIGLLLPFCFVSLFFKFNRTGYDMVTNSLVVEHNPDPPVHEHR
ncbi:hypothetical protein FQR65_LT14105 [Abscondita terminalis]|nr:hypothetical protein FQR65_LT14105 [Abscondita terminalis]